VRDGGRQALPKDGTAVDVTQPAIPAAWLERSRRYGERVREEAPDRAADWSSFDALDGALVPYRRTEDPAEGWLTPRHREIAEAPSGILGLPFLINLGIEGYLHHAEALKLYELAYTTAGDVLELGTHKGLSTAILAHALHDRGSGRLETVDIDRATHPVARRNLSGRPGAERVSFILQDATSRMDALIAGRRRFGFIFVDHWHGYEATAQAAERLSRLLLPGGHAMFHDFFDPANADPQHVYGVYQAVIDVLGEDRDFLFAGGAGGSAAFRYRPADGRAASGGNHGP